ncbi:hypothetical protein [Aureimonas leprariae]|uniref:hypothetical protein n=1 Tax=Plantimonas leprariae TaxID=2615207 RepID=UPI001243C78B|nr:hypothetical protein [Aureimonas leprariae]
MRFLKGRRAAGTPLDRMRQARIVAMIDAGESYRTISGELGVTAAQIDCALRCHAFPRHGG